MHFYSEEFGGFDEYLYFNSLESICDHEYYNIKEVVQYPILGYDADDLPTIILTNGDLFQLNEYEVKDVVIVEVNNKDESMNKYYQYFDIPIMDMSSQAKIHKFDQIEDKVVHATHSEVVDALKFVEDLMINHAIDLALKSNDLSNDNT